MRRRGVAGAAAEPRALDNGQPAGRDGGGPRARRYTRGNYSRHALERVYTPPPKWTRRRTTVSTHTVRVYIPSRRGTVAAVVCTVRKML